MKVNESPDMPFPDADIEDAFDGLSGEEPEFRFSLTPKEGGERLDKVLAKRLPQFSRSRIQRWMDEGCVLANGRPVQRRYGVVGDEEIVVVPQSAPEDMAYQPEDLPLSPVYEDEAVIVINKPAGLVVHPAAGNWSGTLLNALLHHFPPLSGVPRAGIVHRLDKDTSGLLVVAKTVEAHTGLVRQLQERSVKREYLALVWGEPSLKKTVSAPVARHPRDRTRMAVSESLHAKPAITHYERLATGVLSGMAVSLVLCRLETGRTHQIRVHMQSQGFPLVGDPVYGRQHLSRIFPRQALHAAALGFVHPVTGKAEEWQAAIPEDFAELLKEAKIAGYETVS